MMQFIGALDPRLFVLGLLAIVFASVALGRASMRDEAESYYRDLIDGMILKEDDGK
jgi:hypothetical protein